MNVVLRHIDFLLSRYDCVIIPGFGAFIAFFQPARYDQGSDSITPPGRRFFFNQELTDSDGFLAHSVAKGLSISYAAAVRKISDTVSLIKRELANSGEFTFGNIGRVELTLHGKILFTPFNHDRITALSGWLGQITKTDFVKSTQTANPQPKAPVVKIEKYSFKNFVRSAAGAAAAILIALVVSTPLSVNETTFTASTVPPVSVAKSAPSPSKNFKEKNMAQSEVPKTIIVAKDDNHTTTDTASVSSPETVQIRPVEPFVKPSEKDLRISNTAVAELRMNEEDEYVLVVASLTTRSDAALFIANHAEKTGLDLQITESDGRFRVYAATGETFKDASAQSKNPQIARHFKQSWATRRTIN